MNHSFNFMIYLILAKFPYVNVHGEKFVVYMFWKL